jgi:hypothetical protein
MWDIYVPFIENGIKVLNSDGRLALIIPDTIGLADYTKAIVSFIEDNHQLTQIDFFPDQYVFDGVGVRNKIISVSKINNGKQTKRFEHNITTEEITSLENIDGNNKYLLENSAFTVPKQDTIQLSNICFVSYGLRLNSSKNDENYHFTKRDLLSDFETEINNRIYTEGKHLEKYLIEKTLFVEWGTERCPNHLVRATFPELYDCEKLLLSRQKRIGAYSNENLVCDNTIIMAILAKDLETVENRNIKKYYKNLNAERKIIESMSEKFNLKYLLAIINSKLIAHHIKYNNKGQIDFYPNDWKKIPIKQITPEEQKPFIKLVDEILEKKKLGQETEDLENKIDEMVYRLYDLTDEEISIVEGKA